MPRFANQYSGAAPTRKKFGSVAAGLAEVAREFHSRGWALGTSGNFSAVLSRDPLSLAITPSGTDKGLLSAATILRVNASGLLRNGSTRRPRMASDAMPNPSAETLLHLAIVKKCAAGAVLHTHSVWGTILSEEYAGDGGLAIEGYEMLKGLAGIRTHEHREWLPIIPNSQDMARLAEAVEETLKSHVAVHGFLLRGHGLYTWGRDLNEAKRHAEILEFLLEVLGRRLSVLWARRASHFPRRRRASKRP